MRAARGEAAPPLLVRNVIRATGEQRWLLHRATPVFDPDGALSIVVSVIEDLTEVKRAELAQRLLAEAGHALSSSLEYEQALQQVAELVVPGLAGWCAVVLRGDVDALDLVAVAHPDPARAADGRDVADEVLARLGGRAATAAVLARRSPSVVPALRNELLARIGLDRELSERVHGLRLGSLLIVPLAVVGRPSIGLLVLAGGESGKRFDVADLTLARELGHRAAIAVENARLYRERSLIASTLQRSLLPPELPDIPGFRLAGSYQAAGEQNDVGGDFYDVFEVPGGWMVLVGDVAGRGAEAAALTSLSRYTLRTAGRLLGGSGRSARAAERRAPRAVGPVAGQRVLRAAALRRRAAAADLVLAGHPPAFHVRAGTPRPVGVFAPFLGAYEHGGWEATTVELDAADQLVLYTDGVIDAVGETERFGEERLAATLRAARAPPTRWRGSSRRCRASPPGRRSTTPR